MPEHPYAPFGKSSSQTFLRPVRSPRSDPKASVFFKLFIMAAILLPLLPFCIPLVTNVPNYVSWQNFLLFFVTAWIGLSGKYTHVSRCTAFFLGVLGTAVLSFVHPVFGFSSLLHSPFGLVAQAYIMLLLTFCYLALFWWFASHFVLQEQPSPLSFFIEKPQDKAPDA